MEWIETFVTYLGDVVSPLRCAACDAPLDHRALLCAPCASSVLRWNGPGEPLAFASYGGALASVLLRLKYAKRPDLARPLGQLLSTAVLRSLDASDVDLVVPVPVPHDRLVERGFNQAALIARPLLRPLNAHFAPRALRRRDGSTKQASLNRVQRFANMAEAFQARTPQRIRGAKVLLVDDISTTGATLDACRAVLLGGGAAEVHTAVVARTEIREDAQIR